MITCLLLAAGQSRRFGTPKALARIDGQTVIERLQNMLCATKVDEIIVVLGCHADDIKPSLLNHRNVRFVYNKHHKFGQTSSFQAGLREADTRAEAFLLVPVDYPLITAATVDALIGHFRERSPLILIPSCNGKKGHPPLFAAALKEEFLALEYEAGLNSVAHAHPEETAVLPVDDPGVLATFNTPEEFEKL